MRAIDADIVVVAIRPRDRRWCMPSFVVTAGRRSRFRLATGDKLKRPHELGRHFRLIKRDMRLASVGISNF
ncbi:MAG: hypothetical protein IPK75_20040 [Acidobacteria bacterium]|nr:hypothetical protein [Acidobacteriota bacterium]